MKIIRYRLSMLILSIAVTFVALFTHVSGADENCGMSFCAEKLYEASVTLEKVPNTVEATIFFPTTAEGKGGMIFGNYNEDNGNAFYVEIYKNGAPLIFWQSEDGVKSAVFDKVNVYNGEWTHVAITRNESTRTVKCYINGVLAQEKVLTEPFCQEDSYETAFCIGGDHRYGNGKYFKGSIRSLTVYSDVRSDSEIMSDHLGILDTSDLISAYDLSNVITDGEYSVIKDLGPNGYDICYPKKPMSIPNDTEVSTKEQTSEPINTTSESTEQNTTTEKATTPAETTKSETTADKSTSSTPSQTTSSREDTSGSLPESKPQGSAVQTTDIPSESSEQSSTDNDVKHIAKDEIDPYAVVIIVFCASLTLAVMLTVLIALKKKKL